MDVEMTTLSNFWDKDKVRAIMVSRKNSEKFFKDLPTDHEDISSLVCDLRAYISDPRIVPLVSKYRAFHIFRYEATDGSMQKAKPGDVIVLDQRRACLYMAQRHCAPVDPSAWAPFKPLNAQDQIKEGAARKMYDEFAEKVGKVTNFITRYKDK